MKLPTFFFMITLSACRNPAPDGRQSTPGGAPPLDARHHEFFVGLWAVDQPGHALYEATYYQFHPDGRLSVVRSTPPNCTGHLERRCVTGSVANCVRDRGVAYCTGEISCAFGNEWYSTDSKSLVIVGDCSDKQPREIRLAFKPYLPQKQPTGGGGAVEYVDVDVVSVGGDAAWSHDNWQWAFKKCPKGAAQPACQRLVELPTNGPSND